MFETHIVVIHDQIPHISLTNLPLPQSRQHLSSLSTGFSRIESNNNNNNNNNNKRYDQK